MMKKELFEEYSYSTKYLHAEDYDLFSRIVDKYKAFNIPEKLLYYRTHQNNVSKIFDTIQFESCYKLYLHHLLKLGIKPTKKQFNTHLLISYSSIEILTKQELINVIEWLEYIYIITHNKQRLAIVLYRACRNVPFYSYSIFSKSKLSMEISFLKKITLFIISFLKKQKIYFITKKLKNIYSEIKVFFFINRF
jgi:hypothetical protein